MTLESRARELFALWGVLDRLAHVEVAWNTRLRTTAGRAHLRTIQIQLNPRLLARVPSRIDEVLTHEAAHLAAALLHGPRVAHHGEEWSDLMVRAGFPSRTTHDFPLGGLRAGASWYLHLCSGCGHRRILTRARVAPDCACQVARIGVFRAPRTAKGLQALRAYRNPDRDGSAPG